MSKEKSEQLIRGGAAIYVRVSSAGQLGRDGDEDGDGYSIPAQVAACTSKAEDLGLAVAKVYVERAESARSDDRPVLQVMLHELETLGAQCLIVHKVDRLARNRLDDATLYDRLIRMGMTLVSASENIDETPSGRLMHGLLASFAEYYSNNLASEIKKGLYEKHRTGGTPFKPPIGYRSTRRLDEGRDIRGVELDPERAPLVARAFELYATSDWSLIQLTTHLEAEGLTTRPTAKRPAKALAVSSVHNVLRNPYYMGIVRYSGRQVVGRHPKLVSEELFDRVQDLLSAARISSERPSKHEHYLRSTLVCAKCGGRLLFGHHTSHTGRAYAYFSCVNRTTRRRSAINCSSGYYSADVVEEGVEDLYATVELPDRVLQIIRREVTEDIGGRREGAAEEAARHQRRIDAIEANQEKLIQLAYRDLVSDEVLGREQTRLKSEKREAERALTLATEMVKDIETRLEAVLELVTDMGHAYRAAKPAERRALNRAIFERIEVGEDGEITGAVLKPAHAALRAWHPSLGRPVASGAGSFGPSVRPSSEPVHQLQEGRTLVLSSRGRGFCGCGVVGGDGAARRAAWLPASTRGCGCPAMP